MKDFVEKPAGVAVIGNAELFVKMHEGVADGHRFPSNVCRVEAPMNDGVFDESRTEFSGMITAVNQPADKQEFSLRQNGKNLYQRNVFVGDVIHGIKSVNVLLVGIDGNFTNGQAEKIIITEDVKMIFASDVIANVFLTETNDFTVVRNFAAKSLERIVLSVSGLHQPNQFAFVVVGVGYAAGDFAEKVQAGKMVTGIGLSREQAFIPGGKRSFQDRHFVHDCIF